MHNPNSQSAQTTRAPLTFWEILGSTLAAAVGVQSAAKRERDFTRGKVLDFVVAGMLFSAVFVVGLIAFVDFVIAQSVG